MDRNSQIARKDIANIKILFWRILPKISMFSPFLDLVLLFYFISFHSIQCIVYIGRISTWKYWVQIRYLDGSRFSKIHFFLNIWTGPDFPKCIKNKLSGRVQIFQNAFDIKYLDGSRISKIHLKIFIWTGPDFPKCIWKYLSGRVQIFQNAFEHIYLDGSRFSKMHL